MTGDRTGVENLKSLLLEQSIALWKRRWLAMATCWALCITGWVTVWALPNRYESDARAYVDVNGLLTPLLKGLVVETPQTQSVEYLRQTLLSRPNLEEVALYGQPREAGHERRREGRTGRRPRFRYHAQARPAEPDLAVLRQPQPEHCQERRAGDAHDPRGKSDRKQPCGDGSCAQIPDAQIANYETQFAQPKRRRADFRKQYSDYFSDNGLPRLQVLQQQIIQFNSNTKTRRSCSRPWARRWARSLRSSMSIPRRPCPTRPDRDRRAQRAPRTGGRNLAALQLQDTEKHPDVVSAQRMVSELKGQVSSHSGDAEGKIQIPNPAYQEIKLKYVDARPRCH